MEVKRSYAATQVPEAIREISSLHIYRLWRLIALQQPGRRSFTLDVAVRSTELRFAGEGEEVSSNAKRAFEIQLT